MTVWVVSDRLKRCPLTCRRRALRLRVTAWPGLHFVCDGVEYRVVAWQL